MRHAVQIGQPAGPLLHQNARVRRRHRFGTIQTARMTLKFGLPTAQSSNGVPQSRRKPRSARFELANVAGRSDHAIASAGNRTNAINGPPDVLRHIRQKQTLDKALGPSARYRTCPD